MRVTRKAVTTGLLAVLSGLPVSCGGSYDPNLYHGDGTLEAERLDAPFDWVIYTLKLGAVDLSRPGTRRFATDSLPVAVFGPRLVVTAKDRASSAKTGVWFDPSIRFRILDATGGVVCEASGRLSTWVGSLKTTATDDVNGLTVTLGAPNSCVRFQPKSRHPYKVELEVDEPDPRARDFTVVLQLHSSPK